MFLVVLGHVLGATYGIGGYDSVLGSVLLTFRMPMFFFISGYIAYKAVERWSVGFYIENMRKKAKVQIIPTIFFFSLFSLCMGGNPLSVFEYGFGGYWFTIVLFEMFIIYYTLSLVGRYTSRKIVDVGLITLSVIGVICLIFLRNDSRLWNVLCLENLTKYFQFFAFGILCRKYGEVFIGYMKSDRFRAVIILLFIGCLLLYFDDGFKESVPLLYKAVHDIIVRYAGLLVVFIFFLSNETYFQSGARASKMLQFIGRRTLDIYLLHYLFLPDMQYLKPYIESSDMIILQLFLSLFVAALIIALCLFVSAVIRTSPLLAHYLFGAKR